MRGFWSLITLSVVLVIGSSRADGAETAWVDLTIRVYDAAGLPPAVTRAALDVAARALSPASVEVTWLRCGHATAGRCAVPVGPGEVILRLVRSGAPTPRAREEPLGDALVDPVSGAGVLATVYVDGVERLARAADGDVSTLLGRAMAHEIGHLLLGHTAHAAHGLMRSRWTRTEVTRNASADWSFALPDLQAIRARRGAGGAE